MRSLPCHAWRVVVLSVGVLVPAVQAQPAGPTGPASPEAPAAVASGSSAAPAADAWATALAREEFSAVAGRVQAAGEAADADSRFVLGVLTDLGLGTPLDSAAALELLRAAGEQGHPGACRYLAWRYEVGFGIAEPDAAEAGRWRERAAGARFTGIFPERWLEETESRAEPNLRRARWWLLDQAGSGDPVAQWSLAQVCLSVDWGPVDTDQHLYWLKRAADSGSTPAMQALSSYYEHGVLVAPDETRALHYARGAAEAGLAEAQYQLGEWYQRGHLVPADAAEAAKWYRAAAEQKHAGAVLDLIQLLRDGGTGLPRNFPEALLWAQRGAEWGLRDAVTHIADLYNRGDGVPLDYAKSAEYYRQAAELGAPRAMTMLGWIYLKGELGQPDYAEARRWFERAAEHDHSRAKRELGLIYRDGIGVERDLTKAFEWIERAARDGDTWSQRELAGMLAQGLGCERDEEEANQWLALAAKNEESNRGVAPQGAITHTSPLQTLDQLAEVLRTDQAETTKDLFVSAAWRLDDAERRQARRRLQSWIAEPDFLALPGLLPEGCLEVLEKAPGLRDADAAQRLVRQMIERDRPQAQLTLAQHAFYGIGMPADFAQARRHARALAQRVPRDGERMLALVDSVCGEMAETRAAARATLRRLAEAGDRVAASLLAERLRTGIGDEQNPALGRELLIRAAGSADRTPVALDGYDRRVAELPKPPPPDELAKRIEKALQRRRAGRDAVPAAVYQQPPVYPFELRAAGVEGEARVEFVVNAEGLPVNVKATQSTHPLFAEAAERSIRAWRFAPGWKAGRPVNTRLLQPLHFALNEETK